MDLLIKQNLLLTIRALYFCVEEQWAILGKRHQISPAQQHILFLLYSSNKKSLAPSELSDLGCWHISTVSRLLKPMELRGLIKISQDKRPKYKEVNLTPTGIQLIQELINSVGKMDSFPLNISHLTNHEIEHFLECSQKILDVNKSENFGNWYKQVKTGSY
ncbi:MarR family winged helix-turn-helix transcriptional regulator [Metabacillus sediminilitoris]|uniref:MarR family transcriptional regulator n=1 Tax=Metabacillus sediminilitoris TaxID=2567941 RepID=A0A4S4C2Q7_9BACI|nr:MarR family transcriptional regulator [Metabacillus sediminilitoris]QGQ48217.1 MarR family transcriptional regulator [Metabacillus sediminilitoris]THF81424.1 MarR family transcriptional regulator [Metabacillus sediminilitoris]